MESQAAIFRIRMELERDDSEALWNVETSRAALQNRVAEVCRILPNTNTLMIDSDG